MINSGNFGDFANSGILEEINEAESSTLMSLGNLFVVVCKLGDDEISRFDNCGPFLALSNFGNRVVGFDAAESFPVSISVLLKRGGSFGVFVALSKLLAKCRNFLFFEDSSLLCFSLSSLPSSTPMVSPMLRDSLSLSPVVNS
ncbi:hypothetical protein WICMUC_004136 [Wickerhamomyces mucosus]|uniref:Uncharacterized protein n=1 Tax=Wickerhamomyces mucosus TaxID=1378264 RepID=A0A9P8PJL0_9ASCO|nr:hypothetical protein WICMUC_004136 [Wickerhamomyces mucosus]